MRALKRDQMEFTFGGVSSKGGSTIASGNHSFSNDSETASGTGASVELPNLGPKSLFAVTAKVAGRLNATAVSDEEHRAFLDERQILLDKKFAGTITRKETNRLAYVRWSLDRIEDAKYGAELDLVEEQVERYENLLSEMTKFAGQVERAKSNRR